MLIEWGCSFIGAHKCLFHDGSQETVEIIVVHPKKMLSQLGLKGEVDLWVDPSQFDVNTFKTDRPKICL